MSTTPRIKFEHSPAESLADSFSSTPGTTYTSLFSNSPMDDDIMTPVTTPQSYEGDSMFGDSIRGESILEDAPASEKKPVKKRKSWGQQLPEPKTNLPPRYILDARLTIVDQSANPFSRKRAKTEDEKEQRRVERVLRNRRAAQSSRERKRQEVEALELEKSQIERRAHDLELQLANMSSKYAMALQKLEEVTGGNLPPAFLPSSAASTPGRPENFHGQSP